MFDANKYVHKYNEYTYLIYLCETIVSKVWPSSSIF